MQLLFWVVTNSSAIKQLFSRTNLISKPGQWINLPFFAIPSFACWCLCCSSWSQVARTTPRPRFKPGWMTSPFCLGFLYDPGISHFPQQTSASSRGEQISPAPSAAASLPRVPAATPGQTHPKKGSDSRHGIYDFSLCFKASFDFTHGGQPCLRCCHTARGKWAATGRTARSARCPLAAGCRTQAPFSPPRRRRDHQNSDRSAEPSEVKTRKNGRIRKINAVFPSRGKYGGEMRCQTANE